jgi:hypothetical protein
MLPEADVPSPVMPGGYHVLCGCELSIGRARARDVQEHGCFIDGEECG